MLQGRSTKLPRETARPVKIGATLISVLGSLLVVLGANLWAISYLPEHGYNWGDRLVTHKWNMLLDMKAPVDWLILGDSSGAVGVVPSVIDEELGGTSINLCTHAGARIVNDAWMLETYIQRFGPPKHVLLVHTADGWTGGTGPVFYNLMQIPLGWGYWNRLQPPVELSLKQNLDAFLVKFVPLYSKNATLGWILRKPWKRSLTAEGSPSFQDDGLLLLQANPSNVENKVGPLIYAYTGAVASFDDLGVKALNQVAALSDEYGFDVYLVNAPIYEGLYDSQGYSAYANQVSDWLDAFVAGHDRMRYILRTPMTFPADLMENVVHVSGSAAPLYTERIASEIMAHTLGP